MEYRTTLIWQYITSGQESKKKLLEQIIEKHNDSEYQFFPLEREMEVLAKIILSNNTYESFMKGLTKSEQDSVYECGFDSYLLGL